MQARSLTCSHRVALPSRCKRGVSLLCFTSQTRTEAGTERSGRSLEAVLQEVGIEAAVLGSVKQRNPELSCISVQERVEPLLQFLQSLQLQPDDLRVMLLRCPRLLSFSMQRQVLPVVEFLRSDLGFDQQQVASTLKRFPGIMGYGVKSHLVPHCHYLKSLGISEEDLPHLILARPQVLGTSIELVITYLRKWLRIERTHVGRLLWSYPLDYSLPRLVLPSDATAATDSSMDEPPMEADGPTATSTSSSSSSSATGPAAHAASAGSSGSSSGDGQGQQPPQQQQPARQVPLWGSPEACSWLDIDLRKGGSSSSSNSNSGSSGSSDEEGGSGSSGSSRGGGAPRPDDGSGGSSSGPPASCA